MRTRHHDPAIDRLGFTCYRLVADRDGLWPVALIHSRSRMFAFVNR